MSVLVLIALKYFQLMLKKLVFKDIPTANMLCSSDDFQISFAALGEIMNMFLNFLGCINSLVRDK